MLQLALTYLHTSPLTSEGNSQFGTGHQNRVPATHKMLLTPAVQHVKLVPQLNGVIFIKLFVKNIGTILF